LKVAVAARDLERPLLEELGSRLLERRQRLFFFEGDDPLWAQNIWLEPKTVKFTSLSSAAKELRALQRNWKWHVGEVAHRRAALIEKQLPAIRFKPHVFSNPMPTAPLGAWTLLDANTMLYSAACSSPFPDGELNFVENKTEPPSRAYLKLWETFTLEQRQPRPGARVLDLGSSPGGWTWVLDQLGCHVLSVDKAPLSKDLTFSSRVEYINESAFALAPQTIGKVDWLFSDVICYPERLLELVQKWLTADAAQNFVCTLKFQAPTNHAIVAEFLKIPGSRLRHLTCNKHELTWTLLR
jgi:23S rRNA (cytidine2498-2'-O)-methyltransferase